MVARGTALEARSHWRWDFAKSIGAGFETLRGNCKPSSALCKGLLGVRAYDELLDALLNVEAYASYSFAPTT